jgi:hypothetical protein
MDPIPTAKERRFDGRRRACVGGLRTALKTRIT